VLIDAQSVPLVQGSTIDYVEEHGAGGFKIDNPNPLWSDPVAAAVQRVLDDEINPAVASHGGFVSLIDVRDGMVFIQLGGGCQGCGMVDVTLKHGIEGAYSRGDSRDRERRRHDGARRGPEPVLPAREGRSLAVRSLTTAPDVKVVLLSTYDLGRQPFAIASAAAWLREAGHHVTPLDLAVDAPDENLFSTPMRSRSTCRCTRRRGVRCSGCRGCARSMLAHGCAHSACTRR
jgi:Fe-S cluster biogenesis protein NfuA